jgi:hypothetical protein
MFKSVGLLTVALLAGTCVAEDAVPPKFYKLDFVVKEVDGTKVLNARTYSTEVSTGQPPGQIRTGSKVPVATGSSSFTYIDVGVSIDCRSVKEASGDLSLRVDADVSSVAQESPTPGGLPPVVRQNKWASDVTVPLKKPTVVFSSDDLTTKHQMQLELTATPIT